MILTPQEMLAAEEAVFARGVCAEKLMKKAGLGIAIAILERWPDPGKLTCYLGKGNNGGDALVAARHLLRQGWQVQLREAEPEATASLLSRKARSRCLAEAVPLCCHGEKPWIQLDGLLGIGASGPLRSAYRVLTQEMNCNRRVHGAYTVALDIPTGLDGTTGDAHSDAVEADLTLTIAYGKPGLLADHAERFVGRLAVIPLPEITQPSTGGDRRAELITADLLRLAHRRRSVDCYKNQAGHATLIAGSMAFAGAAILCAEGALASGTGLVTLCAPEVILPWIAPRLSPEIILRPIPSTEKALFDLPATAFGVGPGLGPKPSDSLVDWLEKELRPTVADADALNLLVHHQGLLGAMNGPRLLTPHPGEFSRLFPEVGELMTRRQRAEQVVAAYPNLTLLYKGTRSLIGQAQYPLRYNLTGNPGMASGGMGDFLTGVCTGLLAQGYDTYVAASMGAWLCGRAADQLIATGAQTCETLRASHLSQALPQAWKDLSR